MTGDLYIQAQSMFDIDMYLRLLGVVQLAIRNSKSTGDMESEIVSSCGHHVLHIWLCRF